MRRESLKVLFGHVAAAVVLSFAAPLARAAAPDKVTEEVIVQGTRPEIEKRAYTFVTGVTHDGYLTKSLARWNQPICPLVAGIPADQGEFILRGVSQAAPTVLRLFNNSADAAAQRMSAWDRSFLKALYYTPQESRSQRSEIAKSIVRDFMKE